MRVKDKKLNPMLKLLLPNITTLDEPPEHYHTADEWSNMAGCSINTVRHKLGQLVKDGKVKMVKVRKFSTRGNFPVPHYGYVKP